MGRIVVKRPGGKLLDVEVRETEKGLEVTVSGDFFAFPEDSIARLEECLKGSSRENLRERLGECIPEDAELVGVSWSDVAEAILRAATE